MREIDKLATEQFGGNTEDALESLIKNKDGRFPQFIKELNKKEAAFAFRQLHKYHVDKIIDEEFGGKEQFANEVMLEMKLDELGMTKEDVINSDNNPFSKALIKSIAKLVTSVIVPLFIYVLIKSMKNAETILVIQGVLITYFSFEAVGCVMNCLKFKNVKKVIKEMGK